MKIYPFLGIHDMDAPTVRPEDKLANDPGTEYPESLNGETRPKAGREVQDRFGASRLNESER
jgi:hypothetical protein